MSAATSTPVLPGRPNNLILSSHDSADVVDPGVEGPVVTPQWVRDQHARHRRHLTEFNLQHQQNQARIFWQDAMPMRMNRIASFSNNNVSDFIRAND